ncbi:MAG: cyd operon YbgE family protein [Tepidimonas sp.]|uniref:cyd operon YbgE family protein n=1 Tax=Tepidimonas sp. TaxID=2002775 RepID=UPI004054D322
MSAAPSPAPSPAPERERVEGLHWPSLLVGLAIMIGGSIYPLIFARTQEGNAHADHVLALLLFWAMSAGIVRGVGFIPRARLWRWLFSGAACALALALAALRRFGF